LIEAMPLTPARSVLLLTSLALASACPSGEAPTPARSAGEPAPLSASLDPFAAPAPVPTEQAVDEAVALEGSETAVCTAMSGAQLDFVVDTLSGDIHSVEAKAMIGGAITQSSVTLHATKTGSSTSIPISVLVRGSGSATIADSNGQAQTVVASPSGGATSLSVFVDVGATFSITSTTTMMTATPERSDEGGDTPSPTPASPKKAIIKPVPTCPG
jgi:hypothetical protein